MFKKISSSLIHFIGITVVWIVILELLSFLIISINKSTGIGSDDRNPIFFSDDVINKLYNTNDASVYRNVILDCWQERPGVYSPLTEYKEAPTQRRYVNVSELGFRHVKNQNLLFNEKNFNIFVFGGSTTFGYGVKDEETIPSFIQANLRRAKQNLTEKQIDVYNFGTGYYYSTLERIQFFKLITNGKKPNLVIFIDGLNDISWTDLPDNTSHSDKISFSINSPHISSISKSNTFQLLIKIIGKFKKSNGVAKSIPNVIQKIERRLTANRLIIKSACDNLNIDSIFVHQPTPYYKFDESNRTVKLSDSLQNNLQSQSKLSSRFYGLLNENKIKYEDYGLNILWLDDLKINDNQYIDYCHYSPKYSEAIAGEIVNYIHQKFNTFKDSTN